MAEEQKTRPEYDAGHVPMTEEMDSPKRTLPPVLPMVIAFVVLGVAVAAFLFGTKSTPPDVFRVVKAVVVPIHTVASQSGIGLGISELNVQPEVHDLVVMLVQLEIKNNRPKDKMYIKNISAILSTEGNDSEDMAANGNDYDRLFQAYPQLVSYRQNPIAPESAILPGQQINGAEIFGFQVPLSDFQKAKSLTVDVAIYNQDISLPLKPGDLEVIAPPPAPTTPQKHKK